MVSAFTSKEEDERLEFERNTLSGLGLDKGRRGKDNRLAFYRWLIAQDQVVKQRRGLELVLQVERAEYFGVYPVSARDPVQKEFIRQLEIELLKGAEQLTLLQELQEHGQVRRKGLWDIVMLRLYQWAINFESN